MLQVAAPLTIAGHVRTIRTLREAEIGQLDKEVAKGIPRANRVSREGLSITQLA